MDPMSEASHDASGPIGNWKQLLVVAVLAFVVPVFIIISVVKLITGGLNADPSAPQMSEEAVAARIKPVGEVNLVQAPAAPASEPAAAAGAAVPADTPASAAPAPAAPAPATPAAAAARSGEQVYQQACAMCHGAGIAGAPKLGDAAAWKARIAQGKSTLHQHALKGIRTMPPKGGNLALPDAEVVAAVDYMVSAAK